MLNHELMRRQFQIVHKIRNRNHRKKLNQQMNVIGHSTNRIHHPFLVPDESPYISIQPVLLLQVYGRCPIPRGKHNVIIQLRIAHIIISFFISCQFIHITNKSQSITRTDSSYKTRANNEMRTRTNNEMRTRTNNEIRTRTNDEIRTRTNDEIRTRTNDEIRTRTASARFP